MTLLEGRLEDVTRQYPKVSSDVLKALHDGDPSSTKKYLSWMAKQITTGGHLDDVIATVKFFDTHQPKFTKRDINAYKTLRELEDAVKDIVEKTGGRSNTAKRKIAKAEGATKVYEDAQLVVFRIDSKNACMAYGGGTRWCITMSGASYYEQYKSSNVVFHFVIRKQPKGDDFDKIAVATLRDGDNDIVNVELYDAADVQLAESDVASTLGQSFNVALAKITADAKTQPKAFLARVKSNENFTDEELVAYASTLKQLPDDEQRQAFLTLLGTTPPARRDALLPMIPDDVKKDIEAGAEIDKEGTILFKVDGKLHRDHGPAVVRADGTKMWYVNGKKHREDGPALDRADGTKMWYVNDKKHREDGPADIAADGSMMWWVNDKLHRNDGPAIVREDGTKIWYVNNKKHREDGPAIILPDGRKRWFIDDKEVTEEDFPAAVKRYRSMKNQ